MERPGYWVGEDGSIWSQWKWKMAPLVNGRLSGRISFIGGDWKKLKQHLVHKTKYLVVELGGPGKKPKTYLVHRLVLLAFRGPCPEGMEACHAPDNDRTNNHLDNLRWDHHKNNQQDMVKYGTSARGEKNSGCKLTEEQAMEILLECEKAPRTADGKRMQLGTTKRLREKYGVAECTISRIFKKRNWKHLLPKE